MTEYLITIVPVNDSDVAPGAQTVVRMDIEDGQPQVKELTMRGLGASGLDSAAMPRVDFELLLRAFLTDQPPPGRGSAPAARRAAAERRPAARTTTTSR